MSTSELRDVAAGLYYVARQSKNRALAENALGELRVLRESVKQRQRPSSTDLVGLIDKYIEESQEKKGFHAYEVAEIFEDTSDISNTCWAVVVFAMFMIGIASYISLINKSIQGAH
jgi:hypothetical protein